MNIPFSPKYDGFVKTLTYCSYDKRNARHVIESDEKLIDFDDVKHLYVKKFRILHAPSSADGFFADENNGYVLAEFKAGQIKAKDIVKKAYDSAFILCELQSISLSWIRENVTFVLVRPIKDPSKSKDEQSFQAMVDAATKKSTEKIRFYIPEEIKGFIYKDVFEMTADEFISKYIYK